MKKSCLVFALVMTALLLASCGAKTQKVPCVMCNGTGEVKYYYGDGENEFNLGPCTNCDETGFVTVTPKGDSNGGKRAVCGSCEHYVDELVTKEDVAGESRTWCADCWAEYDEIIGR